FDPLQVHDLLAIRAKEHSRVEVLLERVERPPYQRTIFSEAQTRVVAFGFHQENLSELHDPTALTVAHEDLAERLTRGPCGYDSFERRREPLRRDRLQQVIESIYLERADCVTVIASGEDDAPHHV